ncbi:MAG: trigger factor [Anaerolineaceae bacterium]
MKIETTSREDHQVKMVVHIDQDQFEKSMHRAARKIANRVKIPGFRPGKAPFDMVIRYVGEDTVKSEAIDLLIDDVYPQALKEANLTPGAMGKLENISKELPPVFDFLVPLAPEVKLGDYHSIRREYQKPVIDQKDVTDFIDKLRMNYATSEPVNREVKPGDVVYLTLSGTLINPAEGENATLLKEGSYPVLIPEKGASNNDWPFPGFGETLIGKASGSEGSASFNYPDDSNLENLRGKNVEFKYKIESVKQLVLPDLDEAFVQTIGQHKTVEEFLKSVREQLEVRSTSEYDRDYSNGLIEEMRKQASVKYPPQSLDDEIADMLQSLERDLSNQKLDLPTYLKTRNMEKDAFIEKEVKPAAINRLERSLVMDEFTHMENIKLDMTRWDEAVNETARDLSYSTDLTRLRKKLSKDQLTQAVTYETANRLMNQLVFDRMKAIATGTQIDEPTEQTVVEKKPKKSPTAKKLPAKTKTEKEPAEK